MRETLEEYGLFVFRGVIALLVIAILFGFPKNEKMRSFFPEFDTIEVQGDNSSLKNKIKPTLEVEEIVVLNTDSVFDYTKYIKNASITDIENNIIDLTGYITVFYEKDEDRALDTIDTTITGSRQIKYVLLYENFTIVVPQIVVVRNLEVN